MAISNTIIQIKKSTVSGNTPSTLANGEIAINTADGKFFYRTPSGSIGSISQTSSFATVNANSSLILATSPTDTLSINSGNNIVVTANTTSKTISIALTNNVTISGNLTIGSGSGGNISGANTIFANTINVSSALIFPDGTIQYTANAGGSATDNIARTLAQNAYNQANAATSYAGSGYNQANSAYSLASSASSTAGAAYTTACNATVLAQAAYNQANTGGGGGPYIITGANYVDYGWVYQSAGPVQFNYGTL
jgi:hypothetical protein